MDAKNKFRFLYRRIPVWLQNLLRIEIETLEGFEALDVWSVDGFFESDASASNNPYFENS